MLLPYEPERCLRSAGRALLMLRWYALDHEQFLPFSIVFSSHHSGTSRSVSHLSIRCFSRTVQAFLDVFRQTLIWSSRF